MTSPISVGEVSVEILGEAKGLAKKIREQVEDSLKGTDLGEKVREQFEKSGPIKLPLDPDTDSIPEKIKKTRTPKVPVEVDPLMDAFVRDVRRQVSALARQVNAKIPVEADVDGVREKLGGQLKALAAQSKMTVPVEPEAKGRFQSDLQAQLRAINVDLKAQVKVEPDVAEYETKVKAATGKTRTQKVKLDVDTPALSAITGLFRGLIPDIGGVGSAIQGLIGAVGQFAAIGAQGGSQLAAGIAQAAGPVGATVGLLASAATAMGALSGAAIIAVPALTAVAGAAAAIPAALSGIGAAVGTLGLGFKGIAEAFKPKSGGGGGGAGGQAANQARQIASASRAVEAARRGIAAANRAVEASERSLAAAERGVASAQQNLVEAEDRVGKAQQRAVLAQQAVSRARREAVEDIDDLGRALRGAVISEAEAGQAVNDALLALNTVKLTGNIPDIVRAQNAYDRAVLSLEDAKDTTQDLTAQSQESAKKGVEGSDKVQSALQDQADAYDGVKSAQQGVLDAQSGIIDAQDSLASAQDGVASALDGVKSATDGLKSAQDGLAQSQQKVASGGGAVAKAVIPLAPAAQKFVDAIKSLKPAFEDLRLDVQERLFKGLGPALTSTFKAWEEQLHITLGSFADTFNGFFRNVATAVSNQDFIKGIAAGAEGFRQLLATLGTSITDSLIPAFGKLSGAAGPFLSKVGDELASIVTEFSNWILGAKDTTLASFFDRAANALHDIFTTGKLVGQIIGDLFTIITGSQAGGNDKSALDSFNNALAKVHTFLQDPQNQQKIRDLITDVQNALVQFGQLTAGFNKLFDGLANSTKPDDTGHTIGRALIAGIIAGCFDGVLTTADLMIGLWNRIVHDVKETFGIKSPSTVFAEIGKNLILGLVGGMTSAAGLLGNAVVSVKNTVVNGAKTAGTWLYGAGQTLAAGLRGGIDSQRGNVAVSASNLRPGIFNAVAKDAAGLLYGSGQQIGYGLAKGIQSTAQYLGAVAANTAANVARQLNAALQVRSPSRLTMWTGQMVGEGLALGIESRADQVEAAAARLATLAVPELGSSALGAEFDAVISRSLTVDDRQQLQAAWKPTATGDQLLDALAGLIDIRHNGDVQQALSRT